MEPYKTYKKNEHTGNGLNHKDTVPYKENLYGTVSLYIEF